MSIDSFVGVPVDSSGAFRGCERMPAALRRHGVVERLELQDLGNLQAVISDPTRHPETGVVGWDDFLAASEVIGTSLASLVSVGATPIVSGGDCSILAGIALALSETRPGCGLVFVDGHLDTYDGRSSPTGEAADMELAMILDGLPGGDGPIMDGQSVVVVGPRDRSETMAAGGLDPVRRGSAVYPLDVGFDAALVAAETLDAAQTWQGHWIHLDLDVLSTESMPAVDYLQPGGLSWSELTELLAPAARHPGLLGMSVTVLNPTLDRDGTAAGASVDLLVSIFDRR